MDPTLAYTEAHLTALKQALATGERRVSFGDRSVEYRSIDELKAAIRTWKRNWSVTQASDRPGKSGSLPEKVSDGLVCQTARLLWQYTDP